jgi:hypothetical protein
LEEAGTTEVLSAAEAPLAIMPDPVATKKRTGFGPYSLPGLGPETAVLDSAADCVEANSSTVPTAVSTSSGSKKRTGFGPHSQPGLGPESPVLDSLAECVEANSSTVPTAVHILSVRKSGQVLVRTFCQGCDRNVLSLIPWLNA